MFDALLFVAALVYSTFLIWGGITVIRFMAPMVIAPRPALYVNMRLTAIWSVGLASVVCGLAVLQETISRGA
jgi:hypothetical protein